MAYFGLKTESSRAVLQKERRGTLFVDNQRKLNFYLRALWARAFFMRPTSGDYETRLGLKPFIEDFQIHLPDAFDAYQGISGSRSTGPPPPTARPIWSTRRAAISAEQLNPGPDEAHRAVRGRAGRAPRDPRLPGAAQAVARFFTAPAHPETIPTSSSIP
jgi:nitric oxide reductase NorD protein